MRASRGSMIETGPDCTDSTIDVQMSPFVECKHVY